jgi:hypothetical protein
LVWLEKQSQTSAIIGGILSIVHPELYAVGIASLKLINDNANLVTKGDRRATVLQGWSSPFTAITTISNRDTPYHWDNGSAHLWFDILLALRAYKHGRIEFPGLGLRCKYDLGAMVALAGWVLRHGATCPGD